MHVCSYWHVHYCYVKGYNVIAYAAYCQVDQHHRPIAGLINFCPELLRDDKKEIDEVVSQFTFNDYI